MRKIVLVLMLLAVAACAGGNNYSMQDKSTKAVEVSDTSKCTFVKNSSSLGIDNLSLTNLIQKDTLDAGGDCYKITSRNNELKGTVNATRAQYEIWKCR